MNQVSSGGIVLHRGKVLMLKKYSGGYCFPKGRVEPGENYEKAAVREVKEETNIDANIINYVGQIQYSYRNPCTHENIDKKVYWFLMHAKTFFIIPLNKEGYAYADFIPVNEALEKLEFAGERDILKKAIALNKKTR